VRIIFALLAILAANPARADGPTDRSREVHGVVLGVGSATYLVIEFALKSHLADPTCTICEPPAFDAAARRALIWNHTGVASVLGTVISYAGAPLYATGLLVGSSSGDGRRRFDDVLPVLESSVAIGLLHHIVKFTVPRQRPFVHHAALGRAYDTDDNASLFSGHTGLAFAAATAAGVVAHQRGYRAEPYIWTGGFAIAAATGYLRIAADKHWASDVLLGAVVGIGVGLAIPLVFHHDAITAESAGTDQPRIIALGAAF
jgi:membrane-associated phospholipid phosphatase